jgi:ribosome biogenesis SPOUT family RNA methylase Rps3
MELNEIEYEDVVTVNLEHEEEVRLVLKCNLG